MLVWIASRKAPTMTPAEASDLLDLASSVWPNVRNTEHTREAWFLALSHTNFYDAKDAIGTLARERKTIHVSDIARAAERIRAALLRSLPPVPTPPVELADDFEAEQLWLRAARERQLHAARAERHAVPA